MNKMLPLFDVYVMKAIAMTESILAYDHHDVDKIDNFTENRERLLAIIDQISQQIDWKQVPKDNREDLNRKIDYIKLLDVKLLTKLQEHQMEIKREIEQAFKQKENVKGYNLSGMK